MAMGREMTTRCASVSSRPTHLGCLESETDRVPPNLFFFPVRKGKKMGGISIQIIYVWAAWFERWNLKINEDKTRAIYFSHRMKPPESPLTLNKRDIPFVNSIKYLSVVFDNKITWRPHTEMMEAKAFRIFIRTLAVPGHALLWPFPVTD
jgi:hypothetical protein